MSVRLVEGEGFCCSLYKQPLMNIKIVNGSLNLSDSLKQPGCRCTCNKCVKSIVCETKSIVCEMKSLAPASNRMTETDTMILQMWYLQNTSNTITQLARNWSYHYTNTHKTARLLMHMCIPSKLMS